MTVGPTDESAVWVHEIDHQAQAQEKLTLAVSREEYSLDMSSSWFNPQHYLLKEYPDATLHELEQVRKTLLKNLAIKSDPEVISDSSNRAALLKSNLPVIMECLQILERLSKVITTSRDVSIDNIVKSIKQSLSKTHDLFDPLLAQKDLIQSIESAMQVFKQNETLFNLPSAIESSIKSKNYDSVVKEISGVLSRLKTINIEQNLAQKIQNDVTAKVDQLKETIELQLHQICKSTNGERSNEDIKKLISHLNKLGGPVNCDVWVALNEMRGSMIDNLTSKFDYYLEMSLKEAESSSSDKNNPIAISNQKTDPPYVVQFVQIAMSIFHNTYYDILALGQSYFDPKDEFACKDSETTKQAKMVEFDEMMVSKPISHLCYLLRLALVPDSSKLEKGSTWPPNETGIYVNWLKNVLQSVITCHNHLIKLNLPSIAHVALEDFKEFVFELRVRSMQILFGNATRLNKNLHHQEDWLIEVDDLYGGRTNLPYVFEKNVIDTLRFANETIFKTSLPDEKSILKRVDVQASMKELAHSLINSFIDSLDNALIDSREHLAESNRVLLASRDSSRVPTKYMNRLLVTVCNCQFTKDQIFIRLKEEFEKLEGLKMDRVFKVCSKKYCDYVTKISEKFCRIKCSELSKILRDVKKSDSIDLQINLMILNSQIFLIAPQLVNNLMTSIVNSMHRETTSNHKL